MTHYDAQKYICDAHLVNVCHAQGIIRQSPAKKCVELPWSLCSSHCECPAAVFADIQPGSQWAAQGLGRAGATAARGATPQRQVARGSAGIKGSPSWKPPIYEFI